MKHDNPACVAIPSSVQVTTKGLFPAIFKHTAVPHGSPEQ